MKNNNLFTFRVCLLHATFISYSFSNKVWEKISKSYFNIVRVYVYKFQLIMIRPVYVHYTAITHIVVLIQRIL